MEPKYTPQTFSPTMFRPPSSAGEKERQDQEDKVMEGAVHAEGWHMDIDKTQLRWESYVKAGYYVSLRELAISKVSEKCYIIGGFKLLLRTICFVCSIILLYLVAWNLCMYIRDAQPIPVDILVTGTLPSGSGLSSSAAMVVASTLVFLAVNGKLEGLKKGRLVEMAVENEKRVGTYNVFNEPLKPSHFCLPRCEQWRVS